MSDVHGGLVRTIRKPFQGVTWQRCQTHFLRNILDATPKAMQDEIHSRVRAIFDAPDLDAARLLLNQVLEAYKTKAPKAMAILEAGFEDATAVPLLPEKYRRRLRTTSPCALERGNPPSGTGDRIFPNRESAKRLMGA
ncbi:Transposase [Caldibacillus debilis GB1]|uniref:Mutator family transposase n=1 Tax=Caldibacillus debilis GB1 TaxID=1339248 RepID=A0A420VC00_9BACI|nr:Transposase [Caldibacillus debilis GB1]